MEGILLLIFGLVIGFLSAALLVYWVLSRQMQQRAQESHQRLQHKIAEYEEQIRRLQLQHQEEIKRAREESVEQSRHTIKGQLSEQLVPLLPGFEFHDSTAKRLSYRQVRRVRRELKMKNSVLSVPALSLSKGYLW